MLPKKNRVDKKQVEQIFKLGKFVNSPSLTLKFLVNAHTNVHTGYGHVQVSFIAPKSVAKLAVKRNLLRRRGYAILEKYINQFPPGILGVFIFRKSIDSVFEIENEVKTILTKLKIRVPLEVTSNKS